MHPVPWAPTSAMRTHALAVHSIVSHALTIYCVLCANKTMLFLLPMLHMCSASVLLHAHPLPYSPYLPLIFHHVCHAHPPAKHAAYLSHFA